MTISLNPLSAEFVAATNAAIQKRAGVNAHILRAADADDVEDPVPEITMGHILQGCYVTKVLQNNKMGLNAWTIIEPVAGLKVPNRKIYASVGQAMSSACGLKVDASSIVREVWSAREVPAGEHYHYNVNHWKFWVLTDYGFEFCKMIHENSAAMDVHRVMTAPIPLGPKKSARSRRSSSSSVTTAANN